MYLRKSRADEEVEKELGEGETLAKHRKALLKFAKEKELNIIKIREEIVSGESLIHRPEMLELLKEVEQGMYEAVLVMDMERLGRGNMQEQGLILDTFKQSKTKIITLRKTYDLNNDFDEEYSEFEAFMSRKEFKMINRRLQGGRIRSVEDGNYIATLPPYGYIISEDKCSRTLSPNLNQAYVVKIIFNMYVNQGIGCGSIANELNRMGYKSYTGIDWSLSAVNTIIKNPAYTGKIVWRKKQIKKSTDPNKVKDVKQRPRSEWIIADGKHPAIIEQDIFDKAQEILSNKYHIPYQIVNGARNPLAGLIICKSCGSKMVYRPYGDRVPHIMCTKKCGNKSSKFLYVEHRVLQLLDLWLKDYELKIKIDKRDDRNINVNALEKQIEILEKEIKELNSQKLKLHDLLEQGVYDISTFIERSKVIADRLGTTNQSIELLKAKIEIEKKHTEKTNIIPLIKNVLELYNMTDDISQKNSLLKSVIDKVEYYKEKDKREDDFTLILYPKLFD